MALDPNCPALKIPIKIDFRMRKPKSATDDSLSSKQLTAYKSSLGSGGKSHEGTLLGLTVARPVFWVAAQPEIFTGLDGSSCAQIRNIRAKMGYENMEVFVVSDYKRGTCEYRSIHAHELRHVNIFNRVLKTHAHKMRKETKRQAQKIGAIRVSDPQLASNILSDTLLKRLQPAVDKFLKTLDRSHAVVDTQHNYRNEQAECGKW